MASFQSKLSKLKYETNVIVSINGVYYSQKTPDSGVNILTEHIGIVSDVSISGVSVDILKAKTSVGNVSFSLLDKNGLISEEVSQSYDSWINRTVKIYLGFINCSCSFSNYKLLSTTLIKSYDKTANEYKFNTSEPTSLFLDNIYTTFSFLTGDITDASTSLSLESASQFGSTGMLICGSEFITWTGKSTNTLTGLTRGVLDSTAEAHDTGDACYVVTTKEAHAIDILLDIMENELAIPSSLIDRAAFTSIRDNQLLADGDYKLYLYNIENALTFIEQELLLSTNCRLVNKSGKISLAILDQSVNYSETINEDTIRDNPGYNIDANRIVNKIWIKYDYNWGQDKFAKSTLFEDTESQGLYGVYEQTFEFKGIISANGGSLIASNRASRILARMATPKASVSLKTHFNKYGVEPSDIVLVQHRYLPRAGSGLGMNDVMEIMSVTISGLKDDPQLAIKCEYTSFGNNRFGAISPSKAPINITSQSIFEVSDITGYAVGYKLRLWDAVNEIYCADAINTIQSINGNEITMADDWTTTLTADLRLFFANYDDCIAAQQTNFAFVSPDTNSFADLKGAYRIAL
jgi:hypothetical protein